MAVTLYLMADLDGEPVDVLAKVARMQAVREETEAFASVRIGYDAEALAGRELAMAAVGPALDVANILANLGARGYLGFFVAAQSQDEVAAVCERAEHMSITLDPKGPPKYLV